MLRNYQIFIDIVCPTALIDALSSINSHDVNFYTLKVRHTEALALPECPYDLLIYDLQGQAITESMLHTLKEHYEEIMLINVPTDVESYDIIKAFGLQFVLRAPFWLHEFENVIKLYFRTKTSELEHAIYTKLFSSAQNSIVMTDIEGNILFANPYFEEISGYKANELIHKSPNIIKSDYHDNPFYDTLWDTIKTRKVWEGIFINRSKVGELFYEEATITPILNGHGDIERFLKIGKNITRERVLLDQLSHEVKLARSVIDTLLPKFYADERLAFDYHMIHYNEIGGDFIYFSNASASQYHFALFDVIGHGVSSALIALTLTQMFKDYIKFLDLNQTVRSINQFLTRLNSENNERGIYVTGIFMEMDFLTNQFQLINAGHPDVLIQKLDQTIEHATSTNMILGVEDHKSFDVRTGALDQITQILCYTDGLYESNDVPYEQALTILEESLTHLGNEHFYESVLHAFLKQSQVEDDITLCKIKFKN